MQPPETDTMRPLHIEPGLAQRIQAEIGQNVYLCYQCIKCTSGCPLAEYLDWQPSQIMRLLQFGMVDRALSAQTPWLCSACQTCSTRCPQGLDINAIMEFLTREALERGYKPAIPASNIFNEAFLREVKLWGRAYELGLMAEVKLRTGNLTGDLDLGMKMLGKNKLAFLPKTGRPKDKVKPVAAGPHRVAYYPGCSLHAMAKEFDTSARAVCKALEIELIEPENWQCCGSTAAHRADPELAFRLPMENLELIERSGLHEVTMPCAACYNRHKAAQYTYHHASESAHAETVFSGIIYQDGVEVRSLLETILEHVGKARLRDYVRKPLSGLRVVTYYGCLLTRPPKVTGAAHWENPTEMDDLLTASGAQVLDWSYKTACCGASHSLTRPDIVLKLSANLIEQARAAGAQAIAVACPLCHTNLDARQFQMALKEPLPVLYFTQLMALALGLGEKEAALNKNLVNPRPMLQGLGILPG